jgi:hypothetical protein
MLMLRAVIVAACFQHAQRHDLPLFFTRCAAV